MLAVALAPATKSNTKSYIHTLLQDHQPPGPTPPQESLYMYSIHCIHCCRYNQPPGPTPPTQKSLYIHLVVVLMLDLVLILQYVAQHQVQHQHHKRSYTYTVAGTICTKATSTITADGNFTTCTFTNTSTRDVIHSALLQHC